MDLWKPVNHWKGAIEMSKEREILNLFFCGTSRRKIAQQLKVSRNTVAKVIAGAQALKLSADGMGALENE